MKKKKRSLKDILRKRMEVSYKIEEQMERRGSGLFKPDLEGVKFWSCGEGEHLIDIIPYKAGKHDPQVPEGEETYKLEVYTHSHVGIDDRMVICLERTYGKRCPICEHRRALQKKGDADEDEIRRLFPNRWPRVIYNIVCYDSEEEVAKGVQVWHTSAFLMEKQLLELAKRPVRPGQTQKGIEPLVVFPDPEEGKSIAFRREGSGERTRFVGVRFVDRDYTISEDILKQAYTLDELIYVPSYDEVAEWFWGGTGAGEEAEEEGGKKASSASSEKKCPAGGEFGKDCDAFDECENCPLWEECSKEAERRR